MFVERIHGLVAAMIGAAFVMATGGCCKTTLEDLESWQAEQMVEFDDLVKKADGDLKTEIEEERRKVVEKYEALPEGGEKRKSELSDLYYATQDTLKELKKKVESQEEKAAEAEKWEKIEKIQGVWSGKQMDLSIDNHGQVAYKRTKGQTSKEVNAPIVSFTGDEFEAGALGITKTFEIDEWPHEEDGETKMTVDGVELTLVE